MKSSRILTGIGAAVAFLVIAAAAQAGNSEGSLLGRIAVRRAQTAPWHGDYYDVEWGMPAAVVVPPTATTQTHYSWGVGGTQVRPIYHQFHRNWPGAGVYDRRAFLPAPPQPSDTRQMGDYYIRGPW